MFQRVFSYWVRQLTRKLSSFNSNLNFECLKTLQHSIMAMERLNNY